MPFTPLDGEDFTAFELVGRSPFIGLLVCRTNDNAAPPSGPVVWPTNTIMGFGTNMLPNTEQKDPDKWSVQCFVEGEYQGERVGGQSEGWMQCKNDAVLGAGKVRRPFFWAYYHADDETDFQHRGRVLVTKEDASETMVTINPRGVGGTTDSGRRISLSPECKIGTTDSNEPVKMKGVKIDGASNSDFVWPRRIRDDTTRPTIPTGTYCLWWNNATSTLKLLFNDAGGGYQSITFVPEP